jgi:hypothetical protein
MATPSLILVPSKYKVGTLYTEVATTSSGTVLGSLGDFSVTRASVATRVNNQGFIETIPAVTNLIVQSQNWLASGWRSDATGFTITITGTTGTVDPLGTNTANAISPTSGSATHLKVGNDGSLSFTSGTIYTESAFFKQGTGNAGRYVQLTYPAARFTQDVYANFDLQLGTVAVVSGDVADTNRAASIENYGNGWYRCRLTATCNASGTGNGFSAVLITASGDTRAPSFSGTITDVLYGWGAQTEASSSASPYVATTTAAVTNSIPRIDYYTSSGTVGCPALLVEASGSNLTFPSEGFSSGTWALAVSASVSGVSSPDGMNTATTFIASTTTDRVRRLVTLTSGTTYTYSLFGKFGALSSGFTMQVFEENAATYGSGVCQAFNLNEGTLGASGSVGAGFTLQSVGMENYGDGWYRCRMTVLMSYTPPALARIGFRIGTQLSGGRPLSVVSGSVTAWGAQLETGSAVTSYIPTTTGTVTRNADVINLSGAVSGCIGQTEGTIYLETNSLVSGASDLFCFARATTNTVSISKNSSDRIQATVYTSGLALNIAASATVSGNMKIAFAYKSGSSALYINGVQIGTSATAFSFTAALTQINTNPTGFFEGSGNQRLSALAIYKIVLSNPELASLTT